LPPRQDIKLGLGARLDARDDRGQLGRTLDHVAVTPTTTSPGLRPALSRRGAVCTGKLTSAARAPVKSEGLRQLCVDILKS